MSKAGEYIRKILSFFASNLLGTLVDTGVLWLCSTYLFHNYAGQYLLSPFISFECAVLVNFVCSYFFIWKDRISQYSWRSFFRHYGGYNLSCTGVFLFKMLLLLGIERLSGWNVVICNLAALCLTGVLNFVMGEWVVFRKKKKTRDAGTE
ncbi:MAG: GtrA family protein [Bacteroidales bacterium]|nr:GtrA family protein [Bacteroidales bacterium]MBR4001467.1 GtrA family protein [Bacteroidales bacterium]MCR4864124.1 GtrA family protein [Bacteroidales bacterium]